MRGSTRLRSIATGIATAALASSILAAAPAEGCYVAIADDPKTEADETVEACEKQLWIADPSGTKAGNLAAFDQAQFPTLSETAPASSVASPDGAGSGAGYLGTSLLQLAEDDPNRTGFTIKGQFTGVIDALALELHGVHTGFGKLPFSPTGPVPPENPNPTAPVERSPMSAYVSIEVDGKTIIPTQNLEVEFATDAAPTANAAERFQATITGLASKLKRVPNAYDPEAVHEITVRITPRYINTDPVVLFLYGTTEVPSNIVFNPLPAGTVEVEG